MQPDFSILLATAYRVFVDGLHERQRERGYGNLRASFGSVFRTLASGPLTLTQLAQQLGVSKQATAKVVNDMVAGGYLDQRASDRDGRVKMLHLTDRGRGAIATAVEFGAEAEARLAAEYGPQSAAALRRGLEQLVANLGTADEMRSRRAGAIW